MSDKILITDSLFFKQHHVEKLEAAGFQVERLDKPKATEEELCHAIKGKAGYLLGGIEQITDVVIESADQLKAIVISATGYLNFLPDSALRLATEKGIAVSNAPHKNAYAVAEFGMTMSLLMIRDAIALGRGGPKTFETTRSLSELSVGIIGLGHIGTEYARMMKGMGVSDLSYFSRTRKMELESRLEIVYKDRTSILEQSDLLYITLPMEGVGEGFFTADDVKSLRSDCIVVSTSDYQQFNINGLYNRLAAGEIRVAFDHDVANDPRFKKLPISAYYAPNESVAFNTNDTIERMSDSCVNSMISLLKTGQDQYKLN